ncbi:hypothetical protein Enr10x_21450 [Gimesia panareensis]|uniref:Uncharacterized protein n=1 Tax=Gimesia panareensis TaxID=2527978 RepID=A0A517Q5C9_9PLAN|nr:hypothetical protein [Gimesia panareensis]QDT26835.1 hypothetical protein Enr10x_21450 [Gimesia panareensis]
MLRKESRQEQRSQWVMAAMECPRHFQDVLVFTDQLDGRFIEILSVATYVAPYSARPNGGALELKINAKRTVVKQALRYLPSGFIRYSEVEQAFVYLDDVIAWQPLPEIPDLTRDELKNLSAATRLSRVQENASDREYEILCVKIGGPMGEPSNKFVTVMAPSEDEAREKAVIPSGYRSAGIREIIKVEGFENFTVTE